MKILPDILCNGGGVFISSFGMFQNFNLGHCDEEKVNRRLEKKMVSAYKTVYEPAARNSFPISQARYTIAVGSVLQAMSYRGWV